MTVIAAALAITAGAGLIYVDIGLLGLFSRFGQDTANNVGGYQQTINGQMFFVFDQGDGDAGMWVRQLPPEQGDVPGVIWTNGVPWAFGATQTPGELNAGQWYQEQGIEVGATSTAVRAWLTPPFELRISVQDSLWGQSGELFLIFDDCDPDPETVIPDRPDPGLPLTEYYFLIEDFDGNFVLDDFVTTKLHSNWGLEPGNYRVWGGMVDSLGLKGDLVGPLEILLPECPPAGALPEPDEI